MKPNERAKNERAEVEKYLQTKFGCPNLALRERAKKSDSWEAYLGNEFIGIVFRDDEDGETSFHFEMSILAEDLAAM